MDLTRTIGISAVYYRSILTTLNDSPDGVESLFKATQDALAAVEEAGEECTLLYARKLRNDLKKANYINTFNRKKKWFIELTDQGKVYWDQVKDKNWGYDTGRPLTGNEHDQLKTSLKMLQESTLKPCSLTDYQSKVERRAFWDLYREGKVNLFMMSAEARVSRVKGSPNKFIFTFPTPKED